MVLNLYNKWICLGNGCSDPAPSADAIITIRNAYFNHMGYDRKGWLSALLKGIASGIVWIGVQFETRFKCGFQQEEKIVVEYSLKFSSLSGI